MNNFKKINTPQQLLEYMKNNVKYGFVDKNNNPYFTFEEWNKKCVVQTGENVWKTNIGTCWDQVEMERVWFENHNFNFKTYFFWFNTEKDLPTHTILVYKENDKYFWFENAFENQRGIHQFNSLTNLLKNVKQKLCEFSSNVLTKDDLKTLTGYEYPKINKKMSVEEYINFVTANPIKKE